jgi:hypothetical protein
MHCLAVRRERFGLAGFDLDFRFALVWIFAALSSRAHWGIALAI